MTTEKLEQMNRMDNEINELDFLINRAFDYDDYTQFDEDDEDDNYAPVLHISYKVYNESVDDDDLRLPSFINKEFMELIKQRIIKEKEALQKQFDEL